MEQKANPKVSVQVEVEIPRELWIDFLTLYPDVFATGYCGYWLRGVEHDRALGWLVWEEDEQHGRGREPDREQALASWRKGEPLPKRWHRLDEASAIQAYLEGVKLWGVDWFESKGDADTYDVALQYALLGEHRYA